MNFNKIAPFGKEDTAKELQDHAAKTQDTDTLVDASSPRSTPARKRGAAALNSPGPSSRSPRQIFRQSGHSGGVGVVVRELQQQERELKQQQQQEQEQPTPPSWKMSSSDYHAEQQQGVGFGEEDVFGEGAGEQQQPTPPRPTTSPNTPSTVPPIGSRGGNLKEESKREKD